MKRRFVLGYVLGLVCSVMVLSVSVITSLAGGWAAVVLDSLPVEVRAGQNLELGFMVLQHAVTPVRDAEPVLFARNAETGESLEAEAQQQGQVGHYTVEVSFPGPGTWEWGVDPKPWGRVAHFEPLTVLPAAPGANPQPAIVWWPLVPALLVALGLVLAIGRGLLSARAGAGVAVLAGIVLVAFWQIPLAVESSGSPPPPVDANYGRALYVAKGCHACHYGKVSTVVPGPVTGPDLANYRANPAFLRRWLRDPQAVRPDTDMPDLDLSEAEIEALIAFLDEGADR